MRTQFYYHSDHTCVACDGQVRWVGADNAAGNKSERSTLTEWNEGEVWVVVILVARVYVYRETGLSSVRHWIPPPLSTSPLFVPRNWPLYTRDTCPFFEPPEIFEVLFIVSPKLADPQGRRSTRVFDRYFYFPSFVEIETREILFGNVRILTGEEELQNMNIRMFKLVVLNEERDIDKVRRD